VSLLVVLPKHLAVASLTPAILRTKRTEEKNGVTKSSYQDATVDLVKNYHLPGNKEEIKPYLHKFRQEMAGSKEIKEIKKEVLELSKKFPIPAIN